MGRLDIVWCAAVIVLLAAGVSPAYAWPGHQGVSLSLAGGVVSPGVQSYYQSGGQTAAAYILGNAIQARGSRLTYSLSTVVKGLTASGSASFMLTSFAGPGQKLVVTASITIDSMTPAILFPLGCTPGTDCTSAIPAMFNGTAQLEINENGVVSTSSVGVGIESAYLNPFGGPIIIATDGNGVIIVATYSQARIQWTGVVMGGTLTGTFGGQQVAGNFGMLVNSTEDLRTGFEMDQGLISFGGMSVPADDSTGAFQGLSTIPRGSAAPCPGFPAGTCSITGLQSSGFFSMLTAGGQSVFGQYTTSWGMPAVSFTSSITATIT